MINLHHFWFALHSAWRAFFDQSLAAIFPEVFIYTLFMLLTHFALKDIVKDKYRKNNIKYTWTVAFIVLFLAIIFPLTIFVALTAFVCVGLYEVIKAIVGVKIKDGPPEWL